MDPWNRCQQENVTILESLSLKFEDNFTPTISQTLPDSDIYLASLETKLKKLKNESNIIKQLIEKRKACLEQLLNGEDIIADEDIDLDTPVNNIKNILSSRQALNQGEIVELLKYDQLIEDNLQEHPIN